MRTMIVLPNHHHAEAKLKAAREGISLSEYIRRLVARDLEPGTPQADLRAVFGIFNSEGSKIAGGKQAMISESANKHYAAKGSPTAKHPARNVGEIEGEVVSPTTTSAIDQGL